MIKFFISLFIFAQGVSHAGTIGKKYLVGRVKSFDSKTVTIVSDGQELKVDKSQIEEKKKLIIGELVHISLDKNSDQ